MNITAIQQALIELGWMTPGQDNGVWTAQTDAGYNQACLAENMHPSLICQPSCVEHLPEKVYGLYMGYADTSYASLETPDVSPVDATGDVAPQPVAPVASISPVSEEASTPTAEEAKAAQDALDTAEYAALEAAELLENEVKTKDKAKEKQK